MTKYNLIFETLEELIYSDSLTIEEAELINDRAYEIYNDEPVTEDGHSKAVKKRICQRKKRILNNELSRVNFQHQSYDKDGQHGTIRVGNGPDIPITLKNKGGIAHHIAGFSDETGPNSRIEVSRNLATQKGSESTMQHEYSHGLDYKEEDPKTLKEARLGLKSNHIADKEQKRLLRKHQIKHRVRLPRHDRQGNEIRADAFAIVNGPGSKEENARNHEKILNAHSAKDCEVQNQENHRTQLAIRQARDNLTAQNAPNIGQKIKRSVLSGVYGTLDKSLGMSERRASRQLQKSKKQNAARMAVAMDYANAHENELRSRVR